MVSAFWLTLPERQELALQRLRDQDDFMVLLSNDVVRRYPTASMSLRTNIQI
jgi:hypothetical protein